MRVLVWKFQSCGGEVDERVGEAGDGGGGAEGGDAVGFGGAVEQAQQPQYGKFDSFPQPAFVFCYQVKGFAAQAAGLPGPDCISPMRRTSPLWAFLR
jgi:hypothetical protein